MGSFYIIIIQNPTTFCIDVLDLYNVLLNDRLNKDITINSKKLLELNICNKKSGNN